MNIGLTAVVVLLGCIVALTYVIKKLKEQVETAETKRKEAEEDADTRKKELESIKKVQTKLEESESKEAPEKVEAASPGDSASRLERLNSVSNGSEE